MIVANLAPNYCGKCGERLKEEILPNNNMYNIFTGKEESKGDAVLRCPSIVGYNTTAHGFWVKSKDRWFRAV